MTTETLLTPETEPEIRLRDPIPFHVPYYGRAARDRLERALKGRDLQGGGHIAEAVRERLAALLGVDTLFLTPSCTSALELAARVAGFGPGDEVIVPAYTFVSSASAMTAFGARPVFVDVKPDNICVDIDAVERAITPRTKGIVAVHYAGQAADMLALRAIADRRGILLIEDAAQALLCTQGGRALGSFGHMAAFSFHDSKVFTTGEGGACVINDPTLRDRAYVVREKGTNRRVFLEGKVDKYGWVSQGTSAFMGGTAAALLDSQLDEWESILARRAAIHQYYDEVFGASAEALGIGRLRLRDGDRLNHHIYWLLFPVIEQRRVVQEALKSEGIEALAHYPALHLSPMARDMGWTPEVALPVAEAIPSCLLRLPLFTEMTDDQAERVAESVARALRSLPGA